MNQLLRRWFACSTLLVCVFLAGALSQSAHAEGWSDAGTFTGLHCWKDGNCFVNGFTGLNSNANNYCGSGGYYVQLPETTALNFKQIYAMLMAAYVTGKTVKLHT